MSEHLYHRNNFFKNTFCIFREVRFSAIENQKPNFKSKSGSSYYFTETGVFRLSNHWGRAANCKWRLQPLENSDKNRTKVGFAHWSEFHRDNDTEKLYYIEVNFEDSTVNFNHKSNGNPNDQTVFRTVSETTKRIRQIRNLLTDDSWTKYYPQKDPGILKKEVISKLANSGKTLLQIRSEIV